MKTKLKRFFNVLPVNLVGVFLVGYPISVLLRYRFDIVVEPVWLICILAAITCSIDDVGFESFVERKGRKEKSHDNR